MGSALTTDQRHCRESLTHTPRIVYVTASTDCVAPALDIQDNQHSSDDLTWPPAPPATHLPQRAKPPSRGAAKGYKPLQTHATSAIHTPETRMRRVRKGRGEWGALCVGNEGGAPSRAAVTDWLGKRVGREITDPPQMPNTVQTTDPPPLSKSRPRPVSQPHPTDSRDSYLHIGSLPRPSTPPFFKHPRTAFPDNGLCPWAQSCMHSTPGSSSPSVLLPRRECLPRCYQHQQPFDPRRPRGIEEDLVGRCPALRKESALDLRTHYRCPSNSDVRWPVYAVIRVPLVRLARTPYTNGKRAQHPPSSPAQPPRQALRSLSNARHEEDYISESEDDEKDVLAMALGTTDTRRRGCQTTTEEEVDGISFRSDSIRGVLRSPTAAIPFRAPVPLLCRVSFSSSFTPGSSSPPPLLLRRDLSSTPEALGHASAARRRRRLGGKGTAHP
ncbi:hypothetical protein BJ912DRAFT_1066111 [Pholiota molesta]|nr:hypothetical protein BJ912DRAFT_1066111 [Pholiota molesta]